MSTNLGPGLPPIILDPPARDTAVVVPIGPSPGRGITSVAVDANGHLHITYTDGTTADAGYVGGSGSGGGGPAAFMLTVSAPAELVQVVHGLPFVPAGVTCIDTQGQIVDFATKTDPQPGVTELTFGFGFTGQIQLS